MLEPKKYALTSTAITLILLLAITLENSSFAAGILDRSYMPAYPNVNALTSQGAQIQTLEVGMTGYMTGFDLLGGPLTSGYPFWDPAAPLFWEVRRTIGGWPNFSSSTLLASGSALFGDLETHPGYTHFEIPSGTSLIHTGDGISISISSHNIFSWNGAQYGFNGAGASFYLPVDSTQAILGRGIWLGFQTYMQPIPEPNTPKLLAFSVLTVALWRSRAPKQGKLRLRPSCRS